MQSAETLLANFRSYFASNSLLFKQEKLKLVDSNKQIRQVFFWCKLLVDEQTTCLQVMQVMQLCRVAVFVLSMLVLEALWGA